MVRSFFKTQANRYRDRFLQHRYVSRRPAAVAVQIRGSRTFFPGLDAATRQDSRGRSLAGAISSLAGRRVIREWARSLSKANRTRKNCRMRAWPVVSPLLQDFCAPAEFRYCAGATLLRLTTKNRNVCCLIDEEGAKTLVPECRSDRPRSCGSMKSQTEPPKRSSHRRRGRPGNLRSSDRRSARCRVFTFRNSRNRIRSCRWCCGRSPTRGIT